MGSIMRTITLEEHYATPAFLKGPGHELEERAKTAGGLAAGLVEDLLDLGANRIAKMDEAGIAVQAVSLTAPGVEQSEAGEALEPASKGYCTRAGCMIHRFEGN